jgi:hypothetical protein
MSGQREVLPNWAEALEERLRATRIAKAAHLAFSPAGRLVVVLSPVVHACSSDNNSLSRLVKAGSELSVCGRGDSYANALAETIKGFCKADLIQSAGSMENAESVELETPEWMAWLVSSTDGVHRPYPTR